MQNAAHSRVSSPASTPRASDWAVEVVAQPALQGALWACAVRLQAGGGAVRTRKRSGSRRGREGLKFRGRVLASTRLGILAFPVSERVGREQPSGPLHPLSGPESAPQRG